MTVNTNQKNRDQRKRLESVKRERVIIFWRWKWRKVGKKWTIGRPKLLIEIIKCLGSKRRKETVYLCNEIYEREEWPKDFKDLLSFVMIPAEKKNNSIKFERCRRVRWLSHAVKVLHRVLIEGYLAVFPHQLRKNSLVSGRKRYTRC